MIKFKPKKKNFLDRLFWAIEDAKNYLINLIERMEDKKVKLEEDYSMRDDEIEKLKLEIKLDKMERQFKRSQNRINSK